MSINIKEIEAIYERFDISIDADAEGLNRPQYYPHKTLCEFIEALNKYFESIKQLDKEVK